MAIGTREPLPKAYNPSLVEERIYAFWMEKGFFTPRIDRSKDPFVIIQPPPNVTGELHLGRALPVTIEDTLARWHRMLGEPTLWLPGKDHAGIATQVVVEKELANEGLTRYQLGRQKFLERMRQWVERYGNTIDEQHKRLGASLDWSRLRYTLDPGPSRAVLTTFVNLYKKGLIYRGERLINWCPRCQTALSDLEVEHEEVQGHLYYIRYPLTGGGHITIATTRPETMLGDTAVAVHPGDERYRELVGKEAVLPIIGRTLPIIADDAIATEFGTGALKVTPGHDPVDFEIGQRHRLPIVTAIAHDGTMTEASGPYQGQERFQARKGVVEQLEQEGLLERVEPYQHSVGHCERCKTVVEPLVSIQWWVKTKPLAEPAIKAVEEGRTRIVPERFVKIYLYWMHNIRDWCISRQLWWGHRIPVWYCSDCDGDKIQATLDGRTASLRELRVQGLSLADIDNGIERATIGVSAAPIVATEPPEECPSCHNREIFQDPDVLDTWFSSALWPYSTLGWAWETHDYGSPEQYEAQRDDLDYFYPTSVMETAYDILFFWVAKMMMMGLENMGREPFHTVFLHGLIRDEQGVKMSTSKGNVVDPLELIDLYGTDALRFALTTGTSPGNDLRMGESKLEASRNFANKLWNASRFVLVGLEGKDTSGWHHLKALSHREDRWIVSRLNQTVDRVNRALGQFELGEAQEALWEFVWHEYCDWYIEMAKIRLRDGQGPSPLPVLAHVLECVLRLLHPFMPFITEELWQNLLHYLPAENTIPESIMVASYPQADSGRIDPRVEDEMLQITSTVRAIRNVRAQLRIPPNQPVDALVEPAEHRQLIEEEAGVIQTLSRVGSLRLVDGTAPPTDETLTLVVGEIVVKLPMAGMVDIVSERQRLEKELAECESSTRRVQALLERRDFRTKAPEEVVEREEERLRGLQERRQKLAEILSQIASA